MPYAVSDEILLEELKVLRNIEKWLLGICFYDVIEFLEYFSNIVVLIKHE